MKWYFQTVHHELWDYNLPPAPGLIDIVKDGKKIPALAQVGKIGYMFILDRTTGKPVFGVEERPVAQGDVPGEHYSPTQPIPVKPPPIARVQLHQGRPGDRGGHHCRSTPRLARSWYDNGSLTTRVPLRRWPYHAEGADTKPAHYFPGCGRRRELGRHGHRSEAGLHLSRTPRTVRSTGWMENNPKYTPGNKEGLVQYVRGGPRGFGFSAPITDANGRTIANLPCFKPPWGRLIAVNANTGDFAWQVPLGLVESLPEGKQLAGSATAPDPSSPREAWYLSARPGQPLPRVRFQDRQGAVGYQTALHFDRRSHHLSGQERQTIRSDYRGSSGGPQNGAPKDSQSLIAFALP